MIAVDSSALVAIALDEAEAITFTSIMSEHRCHVGWPTLFETYLAVHHRTDRKFAHNLIQSLTRRPNIVAVDFDLRLFGLAQTAFDRYGKGRHTAGLNFGDCMAYAVAKSQDVALLYKGQDFARTDIRPALP
jgi:ribonuclease VapC